MDREIRADGGVNLRDIGGYATADGRRVRWRRVLRSGHLGDLSPQGGDVLRELGVRTVLDLREPWETQAMPSVWRQDHEVEIVHVPRDAGDSFDNRKLLRWSGNTTLEDARAQRVETYRLKPVHFAPALRRLFQLLADERAYPALFHCMTGKDRTGFAAAVLLEWLGVDRDTVIEDYMLTTEVVGRISPDRMRRILSLYGLETADADGLRVLAEVRPEYLEASLERIDDEFGGLERYLTGHVGVAREQLAAVRELLLESEEATSDVDQQL